MTLKSASNNEKGLKFHKLDLHVHTPASRCFVDKDITPEAIVEAALDKGISAIAVTDHNTGEWIDKVKREGAKNGLIVYPGVEVSAAGGEEGTIHIIGIFDISKETEDIGNFLGKLEISPAKYGAKDAFTKYSPSHVIDMISERGGLAIAAHANSTHGLLEWRGEPRTDTVRNPRLMAMEATDFDNEDKMKAGKRVVDLLDGSDPVYKRKLAVYQASDNPGKKPGEHSVDGIGTRCSYFKMDEVSLEGLRQCFADPDVRIRNALSDSRFPIVESLKVSGGFLDDRPFAFHEGLNAILGGKGVGKSLLIEFLRFALDQQSDMPSIMEDARGKLDEKLGMFGKVEVVFSLEEGEKYHLTRTYDGGANEITCYNIDTGADYNGSIKELFPVLSYSQTEIIDIARDKNAQLDLIDNFINARKFKRENASISGLLSKNDKALDGAIKSFSESQQITGELDSIDLELKGINRALQHKTFDEYKSWEKRSKIFGRQIDYHGELIERITQFQEMIESECNPDELEAGISDKSLQAAVRKAKESYEMILQALDKLNKEIVKNKGMSSSKFSKWYERFKKIEKRYQNFIAEKGDKKKLESERRRYETRKWQLETELKKHKAKAGKLADLRKERKGLLDELEKNNKEFFKTRKITFKYLEEQSDKKLSLEIKHAANRENFRKELTALSRGSRIRGVDIELISAKMTPRSFIDYVLDDKAADIAKIAGIKKENAAKLCDVLMSTEECKKVLAIQHEDYPEDVPTIKFRKPDGKYYELNQLSVGQKCSALVIIGLSEGKMPIIIDQPEDSLDIKSVWEDVGQKLRAGKESRQFILTTHNPNIAVASDADKFHILDSTADRAEIVSYGAIERQEVRKAVIVHLEGGPDPYNLRRRKYHLQDSLE